MRYLSLSPSILNGFYQLRTGLMEKWGKTPQDFLDSILKGWEPNEATSRGNAYGALLEHGLDKYQSTVDVAMELPNTIWGSGVISDPICWIVHEPEFDVHWIFNTNDVKPVRELREEHPNGVYEVWGELWFKVGVLDVKVLMRLDMMDGLKAFEFKTSKSGKNYLDRFGSLQKNCYLLAFADLQSLTYCEYQFKKREKTVKAVYNTYLPYPTLRQDVENEIEHCVQWLSHHPQHLEHRMRDK